MTNLQYLQHSIEHCIAMILICRNGNLPHAQFAWEMLLADFKDELAREILKAQEEFTDAEIERSQSLIAKVLGIEHDEE